MSSGPQPDSFGPLTGAVTIGFQHAEAPVANEGAIDFDDTATVAWTLTDDPGAARVKVQAVVQGLTAAMVANAADKSSGAAQTFAGEVVGLAGFEAVAATGALAFEAVVTGNAWPSWEVVTSGAHSWGSGAAAPDVSLARSSAQNLLISSPLGNVGLTLGAGASEGFLGAGTAGLAISAAKVGFFGAAPAAQPTAHLISGNWTIGSLAAVTIDSRTNGNIGGTFYTVEDIVAALKTLGLIAS